MMAYTKRLFAAVKIVPGGQFPEVYNQIRAALGHERISWVNPSAMHLTIKFFGETPVQDIPSIHRCLQNATSEFHSFELAVKDTGVFGSRYQPRVIWFGIEAGANLQALFVSVTEQLKTIGMFPDRQNFVPHLTIGRIREIRDKKFFQQVMDKHRTHDSGRQTINELVLYESLLQRDGPLYTPVHRYGFS
jgi:RNA 2',3'-cyclic 3'-phosphodiesterase